MKKKKKQFALTGAGMVEEEKGTGVGREESFDV